MLDAERLGIETDCNVRWETGVPHHPASIELMDFISDFDFAKVDDFFCWKTGGDGDNGEFLMYEMDVYFELRDARLLEKMGSEGTD